MSQNILITGAAGYIGGSILANFISRTEGPIKAVNIFAAVRLEEQAKKLSKLGVNVIQVDLTDEAAVNEVVLANKIDIVVHTAGAIDPRLSSNLMKALGERRKVTGEDPYFIHSSLTTLFSLEGGWPHGEVRDTDDLFEREKEIGGPNPVRLTNILLVELAEALGVKLLNVAVPYVYGTGSGEGRKVSVNIPANIDASVKLKTVYKFDKNGSPPAVHVSDLAEFYTILTEKALLKEPLPSGRKGYYFAFAHRSPWWDVSQRIAEALHSRGLVAEPTTQFWPSDDMAADSLGFPLLYIRAMCTSSGDLVPVNAFQLGWQPKWDEERFLGSMDDEVRDALELNTAKTTLFKNLLATTDN